MKEDEKEDNIRRWSMRPSKTYSSRWIRCPICNRKTRTKVYEDTVMLCFPLYCPKCKTETRINVLKYKIQISVEPDA